MTSTSIKSIFAAEGTRLAKNLIDALSPRIEAHAKSLFIRAELALSKVFASRVEDDLARFASIKTLFSDGKLVPFEGIYVKQRVRYGSSTLGEDEFWPHLVQTRRCITTGTAGTGKSLLARQAYRYLAKKHPDVYPVFIELRSLNTSSFISIADFVAVSLSTDTFKLTADHVRACLDSGHIALILDGFDEINPESHNKYDMEIQTLARRHKRAIIFVTGRGEASRYRTWPDFNEITLLPLTQDQTIELITKIDEEPKIKRNFITAARKSLFKSHGSFLEVPLLACMMLVTFKRIAEIPTRRHIFYRETFAALFDRHDASKGGQYVRKRFTDLDIDSFTRIFSCFCFLTYIDGVISMTQSKALSYLDEAFEMTELNAPREEFLKDLTNSVCLLRFEEDEVFFIHRSFQEYFCALFAANNRGESQPEILRAMSDKSVDGDVLVLIKGINPDVFEKDWALPVCDETVGEFGSMPVEEGINKFLRRCAETIVVSRNNFGLEGLSSFGCALINLRDLYPAKFKKIKARKASEPALKVFSQLQNERIIKFSHISKTDADNTVRLGRVEVWVENTLEGINAIGNQLRERYRKKDRNLRDILKKKQG